MSTKPASLITSGVTLIALLGLAIGAGKCGYDHGKNQSDHLVKFLEHDGRTKGEKAATAEAELVRTRAEFAQAKVDFQRSIQLERTPLASASDEHSEAGTAIPAQEPQSLEVANLRVGGSYRASSSPIMLSLESTEFVVTRSNHTATFAVSSPGQPVIRHELRNVGFKTEHTVDGVTYEITLTAADTLRATFEILRLRRG